MVQSLYSLFDNVSCGAKNIAVGCVLLKILFIYTCFSHDASFYKCE